MLASFAIAATITPTQPTFTEQTTAIEAGLTFKEHPSRHGRLAVPMPKTKRSRGREIIGNANLASLTIRIDMFLLSRIEM